MLYEVITQAAGDFHTERNAAAGQGVDYAVLVTITVQRLSQAFSGLGAVPELGNHTSPFCLAMIRRYYEPY